MKKTKLSPCPFCGGELLRKMGCYYIHPNNDCFLANIDPCSTHLIITNDMVEAWNRRADE